MATYAELIQQHENKRRDAERRYADAKKIGESYLKALESAGLERMTPDQERMAEDMLEKARKAKDDIGQADGAIKALREAQAEDEELDRKSREARSTGVQLPGGDTTVRIGRDGATVSPSTAGGPVWTRAS